MRKIDIKDLNCNILSVYDYEGKTIQELLCVFAEKINESIAVSNTTVDLVKYLVDEGLKEEIAVKINDLLINGELSDIINNEIFAQLLTKIEMNEARIEKNYEDIKIIDEEVKNNFNIIKEVGEINVKIYGATGNGIDDDTHAFESALSELQVRGGGKLHIPYGVYIIDSIEIPSNVDIIGESSGTVLKIKDKYTKITLKGNNIFLENIVIDGNHNNVSCGGLIQTIKTEKLFNISINKCRFINFNGDIYNLIDIENVDSLYITKNEIKNLKSNNTECIKLTNVKNISISKNNFAELLKHKISSYLKTISLYECDDVNINNNNFKGSVSNNIVILSSTNVAISNNRFIIKDTLNKLINIISVSESKYLDMFDNTYNIENTSLIYDNFLDFVNTDDISIKNDFIKFIGKPAYNANGNPIIKINGCKNIFISGFKSTGLIYTKSYILISNSNEMHINDSEIISDGGFYRFIYIDSIVEDMIVNVKNNKIDTKLFNALIMNTNSDKKAKAYHIENNSVTSEHEAFIISTTSVIIAYNIKNLYVNNNSFNDEIITAYDTDNIKFNNNHLGRLVVSGLKWNIISNGNVFSSNSTGCYQLELKGESDMISNNYSLISTNNLNLKNPNLIHFFNNGRPYQNVSNLSIQTIDDIHSDEVIQQKPFLIMRTTNVTSEIYTKCFVKTGQPLKRYTYFSASEPLFDYIKPNGLVVYNTDNGLSNVYALVGKTNYKTQII